MKTLLPIHCFTRRAACVVSLFALAGMATLALRRAHAAESAARASSALARELTGTWILVGKPGDVHPVPTKGGTFQIRTGERWVELEVDPRTGLVQKASGGTYRLSGDEYQETVDYGTPSVASWVGNTYTWNVKVEGNTFTRIGRGNPWTHVWQRVPSMPQ